MLLLCGNHFTNPIIFLVSIDQFHFEPVTCYETPKVSPFIPPPPFNLFTFYFREGAANKYMTFPAGELGANLLLKTKLERESPLVQIKAHGFHRKQQQWKLEREFHLCLFHGHVHVPLMSRLSS